MRLQRVFQFFKLSPVPPGGSHYHAFICYSHAADGKLAPALQKSLQRFAKPWYQARALRVFRDDDNLSANPDLWASVEQALDNSGHLILLASPEAAQSKWVTKEVTYWVEHKSAATMLIGLTDGELHWDGAALPAGNALPDPLKHVFRHEPRITDLRWAKSEDHLSLRNTLWSQAIADLAAPLHEVAKEELASEEVRQHRKTLRIARSAVIVLVALTIAASTLGLVAYSQYHSALAQSQAEIRQRDAALSGQLAAESLNLDTVQPNLAKQLALAGNGIAVTLDATSAAYAALSVPGVIDAQAQVGGIAFSPDGKLLAIGAGDDVQLWDRADHMFIATLTGHTNPVTGVAFDPDGTVLASAAEDQTIRLWNVADPRHAVLLATLHGEYSSVAFSPDGRILVAGNYDGTVQRWDMANARDPAARPPLTGPAGSVLAVAVSPDGKLIAGASQDGTIRLWPSSGGPSVATLTRAVASAAADQIAFTADSRLVAGIGGTGGTGRVGLWPATKHGRIAPEATLSDSAGDLSTVAFSPHGDILAADGDDDVHLWNVARPQHPVTLATLAMDDASGGATGNLNGSRTTAFTPDGRTLVAGTGSEAVELWNIPDTRHPGAMAALDNAPGTVTASTSDAARHIFAVGTTSPDNRSGYVILWDMTDPERPRRITVIPGPAVWNLEFSPDGAILAVGGADGSVGLWDVNTPSRPHRESLISTGAQDGGATATFSADGRTLATSWSYQAVRLWDITNPGRPVGGYMFTGMQDLEFSPVTDILVLTEPSSFQVWRVHDADHLARIAEVPEARDDLAFSPGGRLMAMTDPGGSIDVWDMTVPSRPRELSTISGNNSNVSVIFSPGNPVLAINYQQTDSTDVQLWNLSDPTNPQRFAAAVAGGQTPANFASDGTIGVPDGSSVDLWPTAPSLIMWLTCAGSGDLITKAQWRQYLPDVPYDPPCRRSLLTDRPREPSS